jgi:hypothetical protein
MDVAQAGIAALNKIDEQRENAAGKLDSAAAKMHEAAEFGAQRVASTVHSAAEGIESGAEYLRQHDTKRVAADLAGVVRNHPGSALLIAAGLGFLAGRALRND